jgi:endogenous inhibitor of DNA gyrase (YacG/DUF329 family)
MATEKVVPLRPTPCPICGKPAKPEFHPFCSKRCADVDLNRWLSGAYVIPAPPEEEPAANDDVAKFEDDEDN